MSAAVAGGAASAAAAEAGIEEFLTRVKQVPETASDKPPWTGARELDLGVVPPLLELLDSPEREVARNAKRALQEVVRHAGRPGAEKSALAMEGYLVEALAKPSTASRADLIWLLSEIGGRRSIPVLTRFLNNAELREHARCALIRIPGDSSAAALRTAWNKAEGVWKSALAEALRARGFRVPPTDKLKPVAQTGVKPKPASSQ